MTAKTSATLFFCLAFLTTAFADTKLKIRQTMQGQSFENTTYIKGKRQRAEQNMGGMETVSITQCDLRRNVRLMPAAQTYAIEPYDTPGETTADHNQTTTKPQPNAPPQKGGLITTILNIKDTGERKQMFGYTARHLFITMETESSPDACTQQKSKMQIEGWYIDATFGAGCEEQRYTQYRPPTARPAGCQDRYTMKQIGNGKRGFALWEKMTMFDDNGQETYSFISEVVELSSATLDAALFEIPAGYREVRDASELYATVATNQHRNNATAVPGNNLVSAMPNANAKAQPQATPATNEVGAKKAGVVRFGLSKVKVSAVGEGMQAAELATALQNTLTQYLKAPNIEVVALEAALPAAIEAEAKQKECDYVIYSSVAHKKGGGGFGMKAFSGVIAPTVGRIGIGHTGSVAGNIAGQVATAAIVSAGSMAANVKAKDEVSFEVRLQAPGQATPATSKQLKAKAKSDGEDILTPLIEQAAQAIFEAGAKQ